MGLSKDSTGARASDAELVFKRRDKSEKLVALAGNPNVGKSTVFNELTGMHQHTGNWPGKTVTNAQGKYSYKGKDFLLVDLPGCYSLLAHSAEEEVARDFLCFGGADCTVIVCDASCLERNLNLVLQTLEITRRAVVCVNLMDEAEKKGVEVDLKKLSQLLGVPVVGAAARSGKGLSELIAKVSAVTEKEQRNTAPPVIYSEFTEEAVRLMLPAAEKFCGGRLDARWLCLKLLDGSDPSLDIALEKVFGRSPRSFPSLKAALCEAHAYLKTCGVTRERLRDDVVSSVVRNAQMLAAEVSTLNKGYSPRDRRLDRIFTSKALGFPIMGLMLLFILWLTISGANYPSQLLSALLFSIGDMLHRLFDLLSAPAWLTGILLDGMYLTLAWVVSVMLPPMAIFFPLFTLLEDLGYLPRVAFNLDRCFEKCGACGKQALTTCMGFGCNAAGIVGCRIIDSPRERLIAMLTNNFVPCNGRLPILISVITMFFVTASGSLSSSFISSAMLVAVILLGILMTFLVSKLLSKTLLKGVPSSFTLELPPFRRPQIGKVLVRSIFDRTLFVLGRAVSVAAPAGAVIWLLANINVNDASLLSHCAEFLDPFARLFGMDGVILLAFILGLPASEIVIPLMLMAYLSQGKLTEYPDLATLKALLIDNGWTWVTALCTMLFTLMHWPCSTACMTIKKESQSLKWTALAFIIPTLCGLALCFIVAQTARFFGLG